MRDITYCINSKCPFKKCERHSSKISKACIDGKGYVSVANFDGVCKKYKGHLVNETKNKTWHNLLFTNAIIYAIIFT